MEFTERMRFVSFVIGSSLLAVSPALAAQELDLRGTALPPDAVWMDQLDLQAMSSGFGRAVSRASVVGNPLAVGGVSYAHGVGTHADSEITFDLAGGAKSFTAEVGVDDELDCLKDMEAHSKAAVRFRAFVDGKLAADSGVVKFGQPAKRLSVDLTGAKRLRLEVKKEKGARFNHIDWAGAMFVMAPGAAPPKAVASKDNAAASTAPALAAADRALLEGKAREGTVWLESLDLKKAKYISPEKIRGGKTPAGAPLMLGGEFYSRGIAMNGEAELHIDLGGRARRFVSRVGIDGGRDCAKVLSGGAVRVELWGDGQQLVSSQVIHGYDAPIEVSADLTGVKKLLLVSRLADGPLVTTTWAGAAFVMAPKAAPPQTFSVPDPPRPAIARSRPHELGIHGPTIVGASPGRPFLFRIPATGKRPLKYAVEGLPAGLQLDAATGVITGQTTKQGRHNVVLKVQDATGAETQRPLILQIALHKIALTPPLGWNSWNVWGLDVADDKIRRAADALVSSGLADHGFAYINIDDAWEGQRNAKGEIQTNRKFPDMRALSDYVHAKGLKLGIYSSPGPLTCGQYAGSYKHEVQDAKTYAKWGVDLLKYDWCSYGSVAKGSDQASLMKPYLLMSRALKASGRDVVHSICQYGMGDVWKWGRQAGGHYWRTTGDIVDTWGSVETIGFSQADKASFAGPGGWNDPDMLVLGNVGWSANVRPTRLTPAEQVSHMTLWSLIASPLLLGNDLEQLDDWTLDLLTNDEVLDVNQDALGKAAAKVWSDGPQEIWMRPLADGTHALGVFNRGPVNKKVTVDLAYLKLQGKQPVRDLWQRKDLGSHEGQLVMEVLPHGAALLKVGAPTR